MITLPAGLGFSRGAAENAPGITVSNRAKSRVDRKHAQLAITLRRAANVVSLMLGPPALVASPALIKRTTQAIKFNRTHKHKKSMRLALKVRVDDTTRTTTLLTASTRVP